MYLEFDGPPAPLCLLPVVLGSVLPGPGLDQPPVLEFSIVLQVRPPAGSQSVFGLRVTQDQGPENSERLVSLCGLPVQTRGTKGCRPGEHRQLPGVAAAVFLLPAPPLHPPGGLH